MMRPIHNVVRDVKGLLWTPKVLGRFRLTANRSGRLRPEPVARSQPYGCSSAIAGYLPHPIIIYALAALCIAADVAIWRTL